MFYKLQNVIGLHHRMLHKISVHVLFTDLAPDNWGPWQRVGSCGDSNCGPEKQKRIRSCDDQRLVKYREEEYQGECTGASHDCAVGCPSKKHIL